MLIVGATAVVACIETELIPCGEQLCPLGNVCISGGCATVEEAAACAGIADGEQCATMQSGDGTCVGGACRPVACGNGIVDHNEACDDGNVQPGDQCSQDCRSRETCDNGIVDTTVGEQCDVGGVIGLAGDGCSSSCKVEVDVWRDMTPPTPRPRYLARMAADRQGHLVMFGGLSGSAKSAETWQ